MAVPTDIRVGNSLLPGSLRQMLGINDDGSQGVAPMMSGSPIVPFDASTLPPPTTTSLGLPEGLNGLLNPPAAMTPDYAIKPMDVKTEKKDRAAQDKTAAKQQAAAYAQSQRMPTLADTVHEQQAATGQEAQAIQGQGAVQSAEADEVYKAQLGAQAALDENDKALADWQAKSDQARADKEQHMQALMADVDATKVDNGRYWKDASTGRKVGWLIGMALAGLGDALQHKSGPNSVVQMLNETIDKDVRQQQQDRESAKDRYGRAQADVDSWDRFSANREARIAGKRAAAKEMVAQQLSIAAAKYGSPMAQANADKAIAELRKSSAKDQMAAVDMAHGHTMQEGQLANAKQNTAIAGGHLKLARDQFAYSKEKDQADLALEVAKLNAKGDPKAAEQVQKFGVAGLMEKDAQGNDVPFVAQGTPEGVEKVREKLAATNTIVGLLDSARRIRTGWTSDTTKSKEWQELQQLWSAAKAKGKDALGLGALSGDDYKILDGYLGSSDPTKYIDPTPGIERARKTVIMDMAKTLEAHNYKGKFDIPDIVGNDPAAEQPGDEQFRDVIGTTYEHAPYERINAELGQAKPGQPNGDYQQRTLNAYAEAGGMFPSQKQTLDTFAGGLQSPDPKVRELASSRLSDAANHAESRGVREYAQQLLTNNNSNVGGSVETPSGYGEGNAVAHETIAEPKYPQPKGTKR